MAPAGFNPVQTLPYLPGDLGIPGSSPRCQSACGWHLWRGCPAQGQEDQGMFARGWGWGFTKTSQQSPMKQQSFKKWWRLSSADKRLSGALPGGGMKHTLPFISPSL